MEAENARRSFRQELKIELAARLGSLLNRLMTGLCRTRLLAPTYATRRKQGESVRCLYAAWHAYLWHGTAALRGGQVQVLVSTHADGEIIARILKRMGFGLVRGSSTRGGTRALRDLTRVARDTAHDVVVTVDGPRGPARVVKEGILFAASRTGLPVVPMGVWAVRAWHSRSWDEMVVGKPLSRVAVTFGPEIHIPREASKDQLLEVWGPRVAAGIEAAEAEARASLEGAVAGGETAV